VIKGIQSLFSPPGISELYCHRLGLNYAGFGQKSLENFSLLMEKGKMTGWNVG
jgi:hypothetical protein